MKSNENFEERTDDEKLVMSKMMLAHSSEKVDKLIDGLTSAKLKRVLKLVSHAHLADALLDRNINYNPGEVEKDLIDSIFSLQECVFGHQALLKELKGEDSPENSGIETTNLTVSLEDTNE